MAVLDITRPAATGLSVGGRIIAQLKTTHAAYLDWRTANATERELQRLSDHELEDIGITRGMIAEAVRTGRL